MNSCAYLHSAKDHFKLSLVVAFHRLRVPAQLLAAARLPVQRPAVQAVQQVVPEASLD